MWNSILCNFQSANFYGAKCAVTFMGVSFCFRKHTWNMNRSTIFTLVVGGVFKITFLKAILFSFFIPLCGIAINIVQRGVDFNCNSQISCAFIFHQIYRIPSVPIKYGPLWLSQTNAAYCSRSEGTRYQSLCFIPMHTELLPFPWKWNFWTRKSFIKGLCLHVWILCLYVYLHGWHRLFKRIFIM